MIATILCARRSASSELTRSPLKRQMMMTLAIPVMVLSMP